MSFIVKRGGMLKKIISIFVVQTFLISNIGFAATEITQNKELDSSALAIDNLAIPRDYGTIKERRTGNNGKLVVYIQDAHCNYEAQTNISKILEHLIKNYSVNFVAVEGADGIVDTSWFKAFPDEDIKKEVADYFMQKGEITGAEFLSITSDYPFTIYGAEDRKYYIDNLNSFLESYPYKEEFLKYYTNIKSALGKLKNYIYSKELRALDNKITDHKEKRIKFADYVRYLYDLSKKQRTDIKDLPNFNILMEALKFEKNIDFDIVNEERAVLIDQLSKTLSKDKLKVLVNESLNFKLGKIDGNSFYSYLAELAEKSKIDLSKKYENLSRYIVYSRIYAKINNELLFDEIDQLLSSIKLSMFQNDDQKILDKLWKDVNVVLGFMNIELTNKEYEYYSENKNDFKPDSFISFIREQSSRYGLSYNISIPDEDLSNVFTKLIDFYEIALKRDEVLVKNMFKGMSGKRTDVAVLITGGFHTKGITKFLKEKDASYIVISPSITKDVESPYIAVLTGQKTPFEELIIGGTENTANLQFTNRFSTLCMDGNIKDGNITEAGKRFYAAIAHELIRSYIRLFYPSQDKDNIKQTLLANFDRASENCQNKIGSKEIRQTIERDFDKIFEALSYKMDYALPKVFEGLDLGTDAYGIDVQGALKSSSQEFFLSEEDVHGYNLVRLINSFKISYRQALEANSQAPLREIDREKLIAQRAREIIRHPAVFDMLRERIEVFGVSGGDCAGLNTAMAACTNQAARYGRLIIAVPHGLEGLTINDIWQVGVPIDTQYAARVESRGGIVTGSTRANIFRPVEDGSFKPLITAIKNLTGFNPNNSEGLDRDLDNKIKEIINDILNISVDDKRLENIRRFIKNNGGDKYVGGVVIIGGDDHTGETLKLSKLLHGMMSVNGIFKSIDNDTRALMLGAQTAAMKNRERFLESCVYEGVMVMECMGRGYVRLALESAKRTLTKEELEVLPPHLREKFNDLKETFLIFGPGYVNDLKTCLEVVHDMVKKKGAANIIFAEGHEFYKHEKGKNPDEELLESPLMKELIAKSIEIRSKVEQRKRSKPDAFGNKPLSGLGISEFLYRALITDLGLEDIKPFNREKVKWTDLGYSARGAMYPRFLPNGNPNPEYELAYKVGVMVADFTAEGKTGILPIFRELSEGKKGVFRNPSYRNELPEAVPIEDILFTTDSEGKVVKAMEDLEDIYTPEQLLSMGMVLEGGRCIISEGRVKPKKEIKSFEDAVKFYRSLIYDSAMSGWDHKNGSIMTVPGQLSGRSSGMLALMAARKNPEDIEELKKKDDDLAYKIETAGDLMIILTPEIEISFIDLINEIKRIYEKEERLPNIILPTNFKIKASDPVLMGYLRYLNTLRKLDALKRYLVKNLPDKKDLIEQVEGLFKGLQEKKISQYSALKQFDKIIETEHISLTKELNEKMLADFGLAASRIRIIRTGVGAGVITDREGYAQIDENVCDVVKGILLYALPDLYKTLTSLRLNDFGDMIQVESPTKGTRELHYFSDIELVKAGVLLPRQRMDEVSQSTTPGTAAAREGSLYEQTHNAFYTSEQVQVIDMAVRDTILAGKFRNVYQRETKGVFVVLDDDTYKKFAKKYSKELGLKKEDWPLDLVCHPGTRRTRNNFSLADPDNSYKAVSRYYYIIESVFDELTAKERVIVAEHEGSHIKIRLGLIPPPPSGMSEEEYINERLSDIRPIMARLGSVSHMEELLLTDFKYGYAAKIYIENKHKDIESLLKQGKEREAKLEGKALEEFIRHTYTRRHNIDLKKSVFTEEPYQGYDVIIISSTTEEEANYQRGVLEKAFEGEHTENDVLNNRVCILSVIDKAEGGQIIGQLNTWQEAVKQFKAWAHDEKIHGGKTLEIDDLDQLFQEDKIKIAIYHNGGKGERASPATQSLGNSRGAQKLIGHVLSSKEEKIDLELILAVVLETSPIAATSDGSRVDTYWTNQLTFGTIDFLNLKRTNYAIDKFVIRVPERPKMKDLFDYGTAILDKSGKILKFLANKRLTKKDDRTGEYVPNPDYDSEREELLAAAKGAFDYGSFSMSREMHYALLDYWKNFQRIFEKMEKNKEGKAGISRDIDPALIQILVPLVNGLQEGLIDKGKKLPDNLPNKNTLEALQNHPNAKTQLLEETFQRLVSLMSDKHKLAILKRYETDRQLVYETLEFFLIYIDSIFNNLEKVIGHIDLGEDSHWFAYKRLLDMANEKFFMSTDLIKGRTEDILGRTLELEPDGNTLEEDTKEIDYIIKAEDARRMRRIEHKAVCVFEVDGHKIELSAKEVREGWEGYGVKIKGSVVQGNTILLPGSIIINSVINNSQGQIVATNSYVESSTAPIIKAKNSIIFNAIDEKELKADKEIVTDAYRPQIKDKRFPKGQTRMRAPIGFDPKPKDRKLADQMSDRVRFGDNVYAFEEIRNMECDRKKNDYIETSIRKRVLNDIRILMKKRRIEEASGKVKDIFAREAKKAKSEQTLNTALSNLELWLKDERFIEYQEALLALIDAARTDESIAKELYDSFWRTIPFGTGGRRWKIGIGPNRMNAYMAAMTAQGHVEYIKEQYPELVERGDAIVGAWDVRAFHKFFAETKPLRKYRDIIETHCPALAGLSSEDLSKVVALVYAGNGILYIHPDQMRATPWLSFIINRFSSIAERKPFKGDLGNILNKIKNVMAGIVLSSSHNPFDNNGTKFYEDSGAQAPPQVVQTLMDIGDKVKAIKYANEKIYYTKGREEAFKKAVKDGKIIVLSGENLEAIDRAYIENTIEEIRTLIPKEQWYALTPWFSKFLVSLNAINGTGITNLLPVLEELGFQVLRSKGDRPTWEFPEGFGNIPNPEAEKSFNTAMQIGVTRTLDWLLKEKAAKIKALIDEDNIEIPMNILEEEYNGPFANADELIEHVQQTRNKFIRGVVLYVDSRNEEAIRSFSILNNICLLTDPDADRVGLGMQKINRDGDEMRLHWVSANDNDESGIVLFRFILEKLRDMAERGELINFIEARRAEIGKEPSKNGKYQLVAINTVVSNPLEKVIAERISEEISKITQGLVTIKVVTHHVGFKFTGEIIDNINKERFEGITGELMKKAGINLNEAFFVLSSEEGEGSLIGFRGSIDKDSGTTGLALATLAAEQFAQGKTMHDYLIETYAKYGYSKTYLEPMVMTGGYGFRMINEKIMKYLRETVLPALKKGETVTWGSLTLTGGMDHYDLVKPMSEYGENPESWPQAIRESVNILEFYATLKDGTKVTIVARPSGTEPKHKNVVMTVGLPLEAGEDINTYIDRINTLNRQVMDEVMIACYKASEAEYESLVKEKSGTYKIANLTDHKLIELLKIFPIVVSAETKLAIYFPLRDYLIGASRRLAELVDFEEYEREYNIIRERVKDYLINFKEENGIQFIEEAVLANLRHQIDSLPKEVTLGQVEDRAIYIQAILWFGRDIGKMHFVNLLNELKDIPIERINEVLIKFDNGSKKEKPEQDTPGTAAIRTGSVEQFSIDTFIDKILPNLKIVIPEKINDETRRLIRRDIVALYINEFSIEGQLTDPDRARITKIYNGLLERLATMRKESRLLALRATAEYYRNLGIEVIVDEKEGRLAFPGSKDYFDRGQHDSTYPYLRGLVVEQLILLKNLFKKYVYRTIYDMHHGIVNIPDELERKFGDSARLHDTYFPQINPLFRGSILYQMTGAHYQGKSFDIKYVTEGKGIQYLTKFNEEGELVDVILMPLEPGKWAYALPGYVDIVVNLGGLRFNDVSFEIDEKLAEKLGVDFSKEYTDMVGKLIQERGMLHLFLFDIKEGKPNISLNPTTSYTPTCLQTALNPRWISPSAPMFQSGTFQIIGRDTYKPMSTTVDLKDNLKDNTLLKLYTGETQKLNRNIMPDIMDDGFAEQIIPGILKDAVSIGEASNPLVKMVKEDQWLDADLTKVFKTLHAKNTQGLPIEFEPLLKTEKEGYVWGVDFARSLARGILKLVHSALGDESGDERFKNFIKKLHLDKKSIISERWLASGLVEHSLPNEVLTDWAEEVFGRGHIAQFGQKLGITAKHLTSSRPLSIQIHDFSEMIIAQEDGTAYLGLNKSLSDEEMYKALESGDIESLMNKVNLKEGDVYIVPAGMPHAYGIVDVVEIKAVTPAEDKAGTRSFYDRLRLTEEQKKDLQTAIKKGLVRENKDVLTMLRDKVEAIIASIKEAGFLEAINPETIKYTPRIIVEEGQSPLELLGVDRGYVSERYIIEPLKSLKKEPLTAGRPHILFVTEGEVNILDEGGQVIDTLKTGAERLIPANAHNYRIESTGEKAVIYLMYKPQEDESLVNVGFQTMFNPINKERLEAINRGEAKPIMIHAPTTMHAKDSFKDEKDLLRSISNGAVFMSQYGRVIDYLKSKTLDEGYRHVFIMHDDDLERVKKSPGLAEELKHVLTKDYIVIKRPKDDLRGVAFAREIESFAVTTALTELEEITERRGNAIYLQRIVSQLKGEEVEFDFLTALKGSGSFEFVFNRVVSRISVLINRLLISRPIERYDAESEVMARRKVLWSL